MNIKSKLLYGLVMILALSMGCKKDDDGDGNTGSNPTPNVGSIMHNGIQYNLNKGVLENYGVYKADVFNVDLTLFSSGLVLHESHGELDSISGSGHAMYFEILTSTATNIDLGVYQYDSLDQGLVHTFVTSDAVFNITTSDENSGDFVEVMKGSLTVTSNSSTYELTFDCIGEDGKTLTGSYKGTLKYYDYDTKKSLKKNNFLSHLKRK